MCHGCGVGGGGGGYGPKRPLPPKSALAPGVKLVSSPLRVKLAPDAKKALAAFLKKVQAPK